MKPARLGDISAYGFQLAVGLCEYRPAILLTNDTRGFDDRETLGLLLGGEGFPVDDGVIYKTLTSLFQGGVVFFLEGVVSVGCVVDFHALFFWDELVGINHSAELVGVGCAL